MLANGLGQMAKGAQATARSPATPPIQFSFGHQAIRDCVYSLESLTKTHRAAKAAPQTSKVHG